MAQLGNILIHRPNLDLLDPMKINGPPPASLNLTATTSQLQQLRVGQRLQAVVIKQLASDTVLLQLFNPTSRLTSGQSVQPLQLKADSALPLAIGQRLQLEVSQLGDKPILKVLNQTPATDTVLKQALMQTLPRQSGMTPLLANLSWINQQQGAITPLPQAIQVLAKELLDKLPSREKVSTAEGLKQAFKESGLFMESALAQATQKGGALTRGNDLKSLLLQLLNSVQKESAQTSLASLARPTLPTMPLLTPSMPGGRPQPQGQTEATLATLNNTLSLLQELGKQAEGSIARTQLHQLASLSTPEQNPLTWSFELPILNQEKLDLMQFIIKEHKGERDESEAQQRRWSVTIALELESLGPMYVRLQLEGGKISTTFWANSADTTALISQNLTELAQRYQQAGLESSELRCFHGQPPETANNTIPTIVLDVTA